ncbi:MAG: FmdB family zinc ribbon protein [Thermodesulfobacteriota bacterium]
MPLYEYQCKACGRRFEELVSASAGAPPCPACKSADVERILSSVCGRTSAKSDDGGFAPGPFPTNMGGGCGSGGFQ